MTGGDPPGARRQAMRQDPTLVLCLLANAVPVAIAAIRSLLDRYVPASDWALIELQVRAVGTDATPLTGAWSRYGWDHPGPLLFYVLALPYRLLGSSPLGIQLGTVAINATAIALTIVILRRHGRAAAVVGSSGLLLLQLGLTNNDLRNEWNAFVPLFAFVLLLVAAWDAADGPRWTLAVVPIAATFVMQTHVAYLALAVPALVVWGSAVWRRWSDQRARRWAMGALVVSILSWIPPLVAVATDTSGNAKQLVRWTLADHHQVGGWEFATRLVGDLTSLRLPFLHGLRAPLNELDVQTLGAAPGLLLVLLVLVGLAGVRAAEPRRLVVLLLATWAVGLVAASRLTLPLYAHQVVWFLPLSMLSWVAVVLFSYRFLAAHVHRDRGSLLVPSAIVMLIVAVLVGDRVARSKATYEERQQAVVKLSDAVERRFERGTTVVIDRVGDFENTGTIQAGMMARLERAGVHVLVPGWARDDERRRAVPPLQYPDDHVAWAPSGRPLLLVAGRQSQLDPPGALLARSDPLSAAEREQWLSDYAAVRARLVAADRRDLVPLLATPLVAFVVQRDGPGVAALQDEVARLAAFNRRGAADLLWLLDAGASDQRK